MTRQVLRDRQVSLRMRGEIADRLKAAANAEGVSMAIYIERLFLENENKTALEKRLDKLENLLHT